MKCASDCEAALAQTQKEFGGSINRLHVNFGVIYASRWRLRACGRRDAGGRRFHEISACRMLSPCPDQGRVFKKIIQRPVNQLVV